MHRVKPLTSLGMPPRQPASGMLKARLRAEDAGKADFGLKENDVPEMVA